MCIPVHSTIHLEGRAEVEERRGVQGARGSPPAAASLREESPQSPLRSDSRVVHGG